MNSAQRYPLIVLEQIPLEARVLERGSTFSYLKEVGAEFIPSVIKHEPNPENLSQDSLIIKEETTFFEQSFHRGTSDAFGRSTLKLEEKTITTDLVLSVKEEIDEDSIIHELFSEEIKVQNEMTGELLGCNNSSVVHPNLKTLPVARVFENDRNGSSFEVSSVTHFVDCIPASVGLEQTMKRGAGRYLRNPCMATNVSQNPSRLILKDVSVKLVDIFSDTMRRRGNAHSNSGVCSCMYCQGEFKNSSVSKPDSNTMQKKKRKKPVRQQFVCNDCPLKIWTALSFIDHCLSMHKNEKPFKCKMCDSAFRRNDALTEHMRVHSDERPIKCKICSGTFKHTNNLKRHINRSHITERPFKCKLCPLAFKRKDTLNIHMKIHSNEKPYKCRQCTAAFKHAHTRNVHESFVHASARPHQCKQCLVKFKSYSCLKHHMMSHSEERPYSCAYCSAAFKCKTSLLTHILNHTNERPVMCKICDKRFKYRSELNIHLTTHRLEKRFICEQCFAKFKSSHSLRSHIITHSSEKRFSCEHCPVKSKTKRDLERHLVVHSDARPFECEQCAQKFKLKESLKSHKKTKHSKEKRYQCAHCILKFKTKMFLKSHLITHSDARPFKCAHCLRKFKSKSNLRSHQNNMHFTLKWYQCGHCPAKFKGKKTVKSHITRLHNPEWPA